MNILAHGIDANYRLTIRQFPDIVEVITKPINNTLELARSRNQGVAVRSIKLPAEMPEDMTQEAWRIACEQDQARKDLENLVRAVRRARQQIRWLVQRLQGDHMLTLTYRENMADVERLKRDFKKFVRLIHARYPDWKYVAVRELQERGALHMHLAVKGKQDIKYLRTCWYVVLGCFGATGENVLGQIDVTPPEKRFNNGQASKWNSGKLAAYISKYIDKGFELSEHFSKRYWASKGMPKPIVKHYWLGSQNITDMILDTYEMAGRHGLSHQPTVFQSSDRSLLWLSSPIDIEIPF